VGRTRHDDSEIELLALKAGAALDSEKNAKIERRVRGSIERVHRRLNETLSNAKCYQRNVRDGRISQVPVYASRGRMMYFRSECYGNGQFSRSFRDSVLPMLHR
jgi:hypothetical protein